MTKSLQILLASILLTLTFSTIAYADVWTATNAWSPAVEQQYQAWVLTSWTKDVFVQAGPLQNVKLDCADAVYSMRLLFSYQNRLPFAVRDPSGTGVVSNQMNQFNNIADPDRRFRAFAQYLYELLDTVSLVENSYPVAISRESIHSGVFLRTDHASHHSWTVKEIDAVGVPYLLYASRPARTVLNDRHEYPSMGFLWGQQNATGDQIDANLQTPGDPTTGVGFRMYREPADLLKPEWQVPGYSLDQYQINRISWSRTMQRALQLTQETPEAQTVRLIGETCKEATDRIRNVSEAIQAMAKHPADYCFNQAEFDDYSTPGRDSRAIGTFQDLARAYRANLGSITPATRARAEAIVFNRDPGTFCPITISNRLRMTLGEVVAHGINHDWSSNPNDTLLARWGLEKSPTPHAASCPVY